MAPAIDGSAATVEQIPPAAYYSTASVNSTTPSEPAPHAYSQGAFSLAKAETEADVYFQEDVRSFSDVDIVVYTTPTEELTKRQGADAQKHIRAIRSSMLRLSSLKTEAELANCPISNASEKDLKSFLDEVPFSQRPYITLLDNGNLRALWKNDLGEQIGVQFLGQNQGQFVLFVRRTEDNTIGRIFGRDNLANISKLMSNNRLERLLVA